MRQYSDGISYFLIDCPHSPPLFWLPLLLREEMDAPKAQAKASIPAIGLLELASAFSAASYQRLMPKKQEKSTSHFDQFRQFIDGININSVIIVTELTKFS
ncbi:MAG: hypothetical protein H6581_20835 [Bacteroidia bacterium]|nr:hypothetical protein [Bacteroidia bacterium]